MRTQVSPALSARAHIAPTLPGTTHPHADKHSFWPPGTSHVHSCTHAGPPAPRLSLTPTRSRIHHCPPDSLPGCPAHVAPETPALSTHPTFLPCPALGTLLQSLAPSGPSSASSSTPPCSPQTFLSLLLSLWREQHSLLARPARPAAWLSCGVSPHPPPMGRRESLAQKTGSPGQPGPPLCQGLDSGGGGVGISARSKGAWPTGHPRY